MPINFTNVPARNRARGRPLKKRTDNPGCGIESTSLKTRRQRLSYSSFLRSRLLPSTIFLSLSIIFPSHSYSPPPKRVSYTHTRAENLFSGHPERDPSLFTLFRHSSRNQRYKYARTVGCWLLAEIPRDGEGISWRDLIHSRARFRGRENDPPGPLFNESRNPFRLFSHQNPPCLPTASIPTLFEIF